jgi:hypothetical protein
MQILAPAAAGGCRRRGFYVGRPSTDPLTPILGVPDHPAETTHENVSYGVPTACSLPSSRHAEANDAGTASTALGAERRP